MNITRPGSGVHQKTEAEGGELPCDSVSGPTFISCRGGSYFADKLVSAYANLFAPEVGDSHKYLREVDFQFSDTETCVRLDQDMDGDDVYIIQSRYDPSATHRVDPNFMALFIAVRTAKEWGASAVTAILPYLAYLRQEKPSLWKREPASARLMADLCISAGVNRILTWHPHAAVVPAFYSPTPVTVLDPHAWFVSQLAHLKAERELVVIAPDAGAAKLAKRLGADLGVATAVAAKHRPMADEAEILSLTGEDQGADCAVVVDDMVMTAGTATGVIDKLAEEAGIREAHLIVSHNLSVERAVRRLSRLHAAGILREFTVTNSIPQTTAAQGMSFLRVEDISAQFAWAIHQIHHGLPLPQPTPLQY